MKAARKRRIAARFHDAAAHYDRHSPIQRQVAQALARGIALECLPHEARVLELGCGTGHLTRSLLPLLPGSHWLVTDIAPGMVRACRQALPAASRVRFAVMDAERPAVRSGFDLICASLAAQWFEDLGAALAGLAQLLTPEGILAVSTLGADTFEEWRAAHRALGLSAATPAFPDPETFRLAWPTTGTLRTWEQTLEQPHDRALDFVRSLRAIGADAATAAHRPLTAIDMRRVLALLDREGPVRARYHVLFGVLRKTG